MENKSIPIVVPMIVGMISTVLSWAMPNLVFQLLFIIGSTLETMLYFKQKKSQNWKRSIFLGVIGVGIIVLLIFSIVNVGSINEYGKRIYNFFQPRQHEQILYTQISEKNIENTDKIKNLEQQMTEMNREMIEMNKDLKESEFLIRKSDPEEISTIVSVITQRYDENKKFFLNLKTDKHVVEIFYKTMLSKEPYHYYNIIQAMQAFGIQVQAMSINEYTLMLWDLQILYNKYSMKQSLQDDAAKDITYDENDKAFLYNDFKITMNEYSDTCNYGSWIHRVNGGTARQVNESLNTEIRMCYKKFVLNFREDMK